MNKVYICFPGGKHKALTMSYDDGRVSDRRLVALFNQRVGFYSCTVPAFEQYVLAALIDDGDFERHINRIRREKRKQQIG